jgi:hypothetical protein
MSAQVALHCTALLWLILHHLWRNNSKVLLKYSYYWLYSVYQKCVSD